MVQTPPAREPASRSVLRTTRRVIIKAGTSVLTNENGQVSLSRIGAITEQIAELVKSGIEVIFVSSGATGMGRRVLRKEGRKNLSLNELHGVHEEGGDDLDNQIRDFGSSGVRNSLLGVKSSKAMKNSNSFVNLLDQSYHKEQKKKHYDSACAAAGQFELMNLYSSMFNQMDITPSQILLTQHDFQDELRLHNLEYTIERLLSLGIVPIINENDAVSGNTGYTKADVFSDNDSLAALCARSFNAEVLIMLTDVDGVYDRPPNAEGSRMIKFFMEDVDTVKIGQKSTHGRGGMGAKIDAALSSVKPGSKCNACIVVGGHDLDAIRGTVGSMVMTSPKGTLFATPGTQLYEIAANEVDALVVSIDIFVLDCIDIIKLQNCHSCFLET